MIDDGTARRIGEDRGIPIKTTVSVLCDLVNDGAISLDTASTVADRLLTTTYRLPFEPGEFRSFVLQKDMIRDPYGVGL